MSSFFQPLRLYTSPTGIGDESCKKTGRPGKEQTQVPFKLYVERGTPLENGGRIDFVYERQNQIAKE